MAGVTEVIHLKIEDISTSRAEDPIRVTKCQGYSQVSYISKSTKVESVVLKITLELLG